MVKLLDADLAEKDGPEHAFYAQYHQTNTLQHVLVAYDHDRPVACGAIKPFDEEAMEVKRMFTLPTERGKGIASVLLLALETWAQELGYKKCILETGKRQPDAIQLYLKNGYHIIPNYGQYAEMDNSVCFEKNLNP